MMRQYIYIMVAALALTACQTSVPESYTQKDELPAIYPDYTDVTIPVNIAPLTFMLEQQADEVVARLSYGDEEMVCGGDKVQPDIDDWHALAEKAKGHDITVEVYAREGVCHL